MRITKKDLIKAAAEQTNTTQCKVKEVVNAFFDNVIEQAKGGNGIQINGFGVFKPVLSPEKTARNPATGGTIQVPAKNRLKFSMSKGLKEALNQ